MLRIRLLFLILFLTPFFVLAQNNYEFLGGLKLNDSLIISYKLNLVETNGDIKGYSITDIGGDHETRSNIFGEYNSEDKILSFRESGIVYTKSPISQNDFCFLNTTFKNFVLGKTNKAKANFVGLFSDNTQCIDGEVLLSSLEKVEKRIDKVMKKISKSKRVEDSIKQKLSKVNLMDTRRMNFLKKGQIMSVFTQSSTIKLVIFDGGKLDGDRINIAINGKNVLNDFEANKSKKEVTINLSDKKNSIEIEAKNEGEISPNTVVVMLYDGINEIRAVSNLKKGETTQIDILKQD